MGYNISLIKPAYGLSLEKEDAIYFINHVHHSEELLPYADEEKFYELQKTGINEEFKEIVDSLYDSEVILHFSEWTDTYFEARATALTHEEALVPCLFLKVKNLIDFKNINLGYNTVEEMIDELKDKYDYALPKDFNFEKHISLIQGYEVW